MRGREVVRGRRGRSVGFFKVKGTMKSEKTISVEKMTGEKLREELKVSKKGSTNGARAAIRNAWR